MKNDLSFKANQQQLEKETEELTKNFSAHKTATATYVIPIVFHIIHTGGAGNISEAQILNQVQILNKEFNRQQADTVLTPVAFKPYAAGINVEFRLATIDPNGSCTNGIERIYSTMASCSNNWEEAKNITYWPSNKYLNIWIVESMHYPANFSCNGGGYSVFPGGAAIKDGVVMRGDLIGSIGTAATNGGWGNFKGRYLVHELGHWFNLRHIWGDATCGNDFVSDTPPAVTNNSGCPAFPHNPNNSCGSNANGEMFTNYMDYTNGPCLNIFTMGQVVRMTAAITSTISSRNNLWSTLNLNATGTNDPYVYPAPCASVPQILPFAPIIACEGDSVQFIDYSYGGTSTARLWNFFGQPSSSTTDSIVKVKYNTAGIYNVALTENYLGSSNTQTFIAKVNVMPAAIVNTIIPFMEGFEVPADFNNWTVVNRDAWFHPRTWLTYTATSYSGSYCVGINNYSNIAPATDDLISPGYNLASANSLTLSFMLHFTAKLNSDLDKMLVYMSTDCGQTWQTIYAKNTSALKTVSTLFTGNHYPPVGGTEWRNESIDLTPYLPANDAKFRFTFTSGGGNNIFIDDINLTSLTVGQSSNDIYTNIKVFPNPSSSQITLQYSTAVKESTIDITDVLGKTIYSEVIFNTGPGSGAVINTSGFYNGVYLVKIKQKNKTVYTTKFIKQSSE
ncbi:MAG: T9SS type A sorting domain-containing protein [Bacteroidetes bacterium]|nr:T9SS type A sorting domain-containing protein [Bacteroidota bacterium]